MTGPMSGPGIGLFPTQSLYPTYLNNAPLDNPSNRLTLAAGDQIPIPRGDWIVSCGQYCILEYFDPFTGTWIAGASAAWMAGGVSLVSSDGFNVRVANRLGCPVGGIVNNYGAGGYVQASTTITVVGGGGSTWSPIVGGQLTMATATIVTANAGAGYGVAPIVFIPPPPPPSINANGVGGVQATGYATISSGTVSGFTFTNPGAGYPTIPVPVIMPNPTDPNIASGITQATISFSLTGSGSITGLFCTNPGAPLTTPNNITLTVTGAGTQATVSAIMMQTLIAASVVGGTTITTSGTVAALVTSVGGEPLSAGPATPVYGTIVNGPEYLLLRAIPRPASVKLTIGAVGTLAAQVGVIYDGGLFYSPATPILSYLSSVLAPAATVTGTSTIVLTMGSRPDIITMQPLR